jgi:dihydroorotate dehydrogenase electron transfer subunit
VKHALIVAGGIGSAPLALLTQRLQAAKTRVTMVQAARTEELLIASDFFEGLVDDYVVATDDGSRGHEGLITKPLQSVLADPDNSFDCAYICGPEVMQEACAKLCLDADIMATYVSLERLMACGVGACLSCVVPTVAGLKRVCADGPIFNATEVNWEDAKGSRVH